MSRDAIALFVEETIEGLYRCEARLGNWGPRDSGEYGYLYFGRDVLDFGQRLVVSLGQGPGGGQVFDGLITGLEAEYPSAGGAQVVVLAEDRLQAMRMKRRTRTFEDVSDEDVVRQVANDHGLTPELSLAGPTYPLLAQVNQSDLAFIRERVRSVNAELWVEGNRLFARPRSERGEATVELRYGVNLLAFAARADLAHQCSEFGVGGWDVAAKEAIEETAGEATVSAELNGGTGGGSILSSALGERQERIVLPWPATTAEARAVAEARYRERARRFVTGSGQADGDVRIRVGASVSLAGLGSLFDGRYIVVRARHTYDLAHGFRTEFDVERPGLGPAQS
jgi:phage protein D